MTDDGYARWQRANQAGLAAALAEVRSALAAHVGEEEWESLPVEEEAGEEPAPVAPPALETLCRTFELAAGDRLLLLLCAGVELDAAVPSLCARAQGDPQQTSPTFALARALFPEIPWSALSPAAPLRYWRLIEVGPASSLILAPLRIEEFALHYLAGLGSPDERLAGLLRPVPPPRDLAPSQRAVAGSLAAAWTRAARQDEAVPALQLHGEDPAGRRAVAAATGELLGTTLSRIAAETLPPAAPDFATFVRLWQRHALLTGGGLLVECDDLDPADRAREGLLRRLEEEVDGLLLISSRERRPPRERPLLGGEVCPPAVAEQRELWQAALVESGLDTAGLGTAGLEPLVAQFRLGPAGIRAACAEVRNRLETGGEGKDAGALLWDACRALARPRLDDLTRRIEPRAAWEDLILPEEQLALLRGIAVQVRQRFRVYETWGFAARGARGLGVNALFTGASGTGKTTAAEVLVRDLALDLYRVDLAAVVSKYIGETEKNLSRIFAAAEEGGAVLLFDEADALFGKRGEVRDSHDRYANVEVSYLLQRMETYRGLSILTTNLKENLDPAFLRRIGTVVDFPFPDRAQRGAIWRRIFPPQTPTAGLDCDRLSRLNVNGGHIRNMAVHAAFLAADAGEPVGMHHLHAAARRELAKLGRSPGEEQLF
jgi:hypothetical protein